METRRVLILGAGGQIARHVVEFLAGDGDIQMTLFARRAGDLADIDAANSMVTQGDVLNEGELNAAVEGQDIVYANLSGPVDRMAKAVVGSMESNGVDRLIFVTSLGIYDEIPGKFGEWNKRMIGADLVRYRHAADVIEASTLDYTIIRPAWLTDNDEVDYETTQKNEPFKGTEVSRKSVASYIADVISHPDTASRSSVGVNKPNTEGDKPSF